MRRPYKHGQTKPKNAARTLSPELEWLVDEWRTSSPDRRLQLVLAKIRHEEKSTEIRRSAL